MVSPQLLSSCISPNYSKIKEKRVRSIGLKGCLIDLGLPPGLRELEDPALQLPPRSGQLSSSPSCSPELSRFPRSQHPPSAPPAPLSSLLSMRSTAVNREHHIIAGKPFLTPKARITASTSQPTLPLLRAPSTSPSSKSQRAPRRALSSIVAGSASGFEGSPCNNAQACIYTSRTKGCSTWGTPDYTGSPGRGLCSACAAV